MQTILQNWLVPSPVCVAGQCGVVLQACLHNKTHPPCYSPLRTSVSTGSGDLDSAGGRMDRGVSDSES